MSFFWGGCKRKESLDDILSRNNTDSIRYICSIVVLLSHINYDGGMYYLGLFHFVAVTFFFVISGYGQICSIKRNQNIFIRKQLARIIKTVGFVLVIQFIEKINGWNVGNGGLYWLYVVTLFYLIFLLFSIFINNINVIALFVSISVIIYIVIIRMMKYMDISVSILGWESQIFGIIVGMILALNKDKIEKIINKNKRIIFIISFAILIPCLFIYTQPHDISEVTMLQFVLRIIISSCFINLLLVMFTIIKIDNKIVIFIGKFMSFYIFVFHGLVKNIIIEYLNINDESIVAFCTIIGTFIISATFVFIENGIFKRVG